MQRITLLLCALAAVSSCTSRHAVNEQCAFDDDCDSPLVCAASFCRAACVSDRDCVGGYVCLPSGAPGLRVCLPPAQNARCTHDTDCAGDLVCLPRGVCGRECLADIDCEVRNPYTRCETTAGRCYIPRDASTPDALDATGDVATDVARDTATDRPSDAGDATADIPVVDAGPVTPSSSVRRAFPPMGAVLTGLPGELRWIEPAGSAGTFTTLEIQVCDDPACAVVTHRFSPPPLNSATATSAANGRVAFTTPPLSAGTHYWRLRTTERGTLTPYTPAWRFSVRRPSAATHTLALLQGRTHDFNLDGYADAIAGAPAQQTLRFAVWNATAMVPTSGAVTAMSLGLGAVANFGARVRFAGDWNDDGREDVLAAGDPERVELLTASSGATTTFARATSATAAAGSGFGTAFAGVGDLNGDGFDDAVISAPSDADHPGYRVFLGSLRGAASLSSPVVVDAIPGTGTIIAPVGDMNGDGYPDFMVGSSPTAEIPVSMVMGSGTDLTFPHNIVARPKAASFGQYGVAIAGVGDFNGDGYPDAVVTQSGLDGTPGQAFLLLGSTDGALDGGPLPTAIGAPADLGAAVTGAGDLNGDGYADVVASNGVGSFLVLYLGSPTPARAATLVVANPAFRTGTVALATGDDYNNDGRTELLIGSSVGGTVLVLRMVAGRDTPVLGTYLPAAEASLGAALALRETGPTRRMCMLKGS